MHRSGSQQEFGNGATVSTRREKFSQKKVEEMFQRYASVEEDEDDIDDLGLGPDTIGPNGIGLFLNDLGFTEDDIIGFMVSWKFNAKQMGVIEKDQFFKVLSLLHVDNLKSLKDLIPQLEAELRVKNKVVYNYAWSISREPGSRTLDLESCKILLQVFLPQQEYSHTGSFLAFLDDQTSYRALNRDQWDNFYDFATTIESDLGNFQDDGAWPCLIDEYVQWYQAFLLEKNQGIAEGGAATAAAE